MDITYQIVTNLSCNLDCEYCYEKKYARNNKIDDVVDFIHACFERDKERKDVDGVIIDIIGGEPFMQPKLLVAAFETAEMLAKQYNKPYAFSLSTNGTLFNKQTSRDIIERWRDKLSIGVSIDGLPTNHDKYRIYANTGDGSYADAVAGYQYLKSMNIRELGVKATFTVDTLPVYAASMKNLIDVTGGGSIIGNVVFENIITKDMAPFIANQMIEVLEYWCSKGMHLDPRNTLFGLCPDGINFDNLFNPALREDLLNPDSEFRNSSDRIRPYCGSVKWMTCLGFDRNVYGCNRFMSSVTTRTAIAKLEGRTIVPIDNNKLYNEVENQYYDFPEECKACPLKHMCSSCAAAPYENKDGGDEARAEYHSEKRQCGWTFAKVIVAQWWRRKFGTYDRKTNTCSCNTCSCTKDSE